MPSVIVIDLLVQPHNGAGMLEMPLGGSQGAVREACLPLGAGLRYLATQRMLPEGQ